MSDTGTTERQDMDAEGGGRDDGKRRVLLRRLRRRPRTGRRTLVSTAALPAMFTILNGLAGFASIHFATKDALGEAGLANLKNAAWLIFGAMVFDMLDGRVARMTRRTSDFGGQLDSLCDMISFGVAPAMLMLRTVMMVLRGHVERVEVLSGALSGGLVVERAVWCFAGAYVACAALRLARFNVESDPDESAHMEFRGLPSPGAAAAVAAMVLLFVRLAPLDEGWRSSTWILMTVSITLPFLALLTALLMVSRFRYPHLVNKYIRSKTPFSFLVKLAIILPAAILYSFITAAVATMGYALCGPLRACWNKLRRKRPVEEDHKPAAP